MNFHVNLNPVAMIYEVYEDQRLINRQSVQLPLIFHRSQFAQTCQEMAQDKRPLRLKVIAPDDVIWDQFEQKQKRIENYIEFKNLAFLDKYGRN